MDAKRTRRVLIVAFVLSLVLHTLVATVVHWRVPTDRSSRVQVVHIEQMHPLPITHRTPPPPTPRPTPTPALRKPAPAPSAAPKARQRLRPHGSQAVGSGASPRPSAPASPSPLPTASPTPSCLGVETPAALASAPPIPQIDPALRAARMSGVVRVKVSLDASGAVRGAAIVASSGSPGFDALAMRMAREAAYVPARRACKAVAGSYTFAVRLFAW